MNDLELKARIKTILDEEIVVFTTNGKIQTSSGKSYFLKSGFPSDIYSCELTGLKELYKTNTINVCRGILAQHDFILTEYIEPAVQKKNFHSRFGRSLAKLHQTTGPSYGFKENNYIGVNPQLNVPSKEESTDWVAFYYNKRLLYQYKMAEKNHKVSNDMKRCFKKIETQIEKLLRPYVEPPTLIHGDLWSGNYICSQDNQAVLIDPAVYYGQREAELALTRLFGGFDSDFYKGYEKEYPLQEGWQHREGIYRLYHVMNHLNIFGSGYLSEAEQLIRKYSEGS